MAILLLVTVCILQRSTTTIVINAEISDNDNKTSKLKSKYDAENEQAILRIHVPGVQDSKTDTTKSSSHEHSHTALTTAQTFPTMKSPHDTLQKVYNKTHNSEDTPKKQATSNNTSHPTEHQKYTNRTIHMQITPKITISPKTQNTTPNHSKVYRTSEEKQLVTKYLANSNNDDLEIMQKQLNLTYCLIFYIEKEKMEHAKLDLWAVYVTLKTATNTTITATEKYIMTVTESLTGWTTADATLNQQSVRDLITDELANTIELVQQMKDFLSITNINTMRVYQNSLKLNDQFLLKQQLKNYESETTLLNLKYQLYIKGPTVAPNSSKSDVLDTLIYYPLLQRYVSLLVDTLSAKNTCLKVNSYL